MKSDDVNESLPLDGGGVVEEVATAPGGVRIVGATPVSASEETATDAEEVVESAPAVELPHWADPPTGQLNIVGDGEAVTGPTWREDAADWEQDSLAFEASMLVDDTAAVTETAEEKVERQPWDFESEELSSATASSDPGSFSADAYESIPTEEELFSSLGALSAAAVSSGGAEEEPVVEPPVRRSRKLRNLTQREEKAAALSEAEEEPAAS